MFLNAAALLAALLLSSSNACSRELKPHERLRAPKENLTQGDGLIVSNIHDNSKSSTNSTLQIQVASPAALTSTASSSNNLTSSFFTPNFTNANASQFSVNSSALPLVTFPLQTSWAGRLPISGDRNESRELFFWYWPSSANTSSDTLTIWLNGGPGCSSLEGFLEENGPLSWHPGTNGPVVNPNAWTTQSDVVYIEQPVGTGFTKGTPNIKDESQLADQFYGFLGQFYSVFPELLNKKLFIAGESYAGFYIPYIATRIIDASSEEKAKLALDLQGLLINDGVYSSFLVGEDIPAANFSATWKSTLGLSDGDVSSLQSAADSCGYTDIMNQITYPPKTKFTFPNKGLDVDAVGCDLFNTFYEKAYKANPCFNIYKITDKCPAPTDSIEGYFSRSDVQAALHVPNSGPWYLCYGQEGDVFPEGDASPYSETLFPHLLDSLPRGITLWHGLTDAILLNYGDRITIQNLTWGGAQGFQSAPSTPLLVGGSQRGVWHTERNLTYIEVDNAGHMIPEDQPDVGLHIFTAVIGKGTIGGQDAGTGNQSSGSGEQGSDSGSEDHQSASWQLEPPACLWLGLGVVGWLVVSGGSI